MLLLLPYPFKGTKSWCALCPGFCRRVLQEVVKLSPRMTHSAVTALVHPICQECHPFSTRKHLGSCLHEYPGERKDGIPPTSWFNLCVCSHEWWATAREGYFSVYPVPTSLSLFPHITFYMVFLLSFAPVFSPQTGYQRSFSEKAIK